MFTIHQTIFTTVHLDFVEYVTRNINNINDMKCNTLFCIINYFTLK